MKKNIYILLIFLGSFILPTNFIKTKQVIFQRKKLLENSRIVNNKRQITNINQIDNSNQDSDLENNIIIGNKNTCCTTASKSDTKLNRTPNFIDKPEILSEITKSPDQKKIIILSSKGGGGHTAVSNAIKGYLKDLYDIKSYNLFQEVIPSWDTINWITFGKLSGEDFYNFCLQCRWTGMANRYLNAGITIINYRKDYVKSLLEDFFKKNKPDLIISVIPLVNYIVLEVAKELNIPFLIVTNDLDTTNYINQLNKPNYKKFLYTLAFDDNQMRKKIEPANIPANQVRITGFPLRPSFFTPKNKNSIYKDFSIPNNKPVIMILMGGTGSLAALRYVKILAGIPTPAHVIVCLGRNEKLRRNINRIILPEHITLSVIGFTDRIADLMSVSDVLITKPGPGSVCEAIESQLPMILDMTNTPCWWELMNIEFAEKYKFGETITHFRDLKKILPKYLKDKNYISKIKKSMANFKKENFEVNIKKIVAQLLSM